MLFSDVFQVGLAPNPGQGRSLGLAVSAPSLPSIDPFVSFSSAQAFQDVLRTLGSALVETQEDGEPMPSDSAIAFARRLARACTEETAKIAAAAGAPMPRFGASVDSQGRITVVSQAQKGARVTFIVTRDASKVKIILVTAEGDVSSSETSL